MVYQAHSLFDTPQNNTHCYFKDVMGPAIAVANYWKKLVYQIKGNGKVFAGDRIGSNKH
jgi:hypothetical protein